MRWWLMISLCIAGLLALGCPTDDGDDDDSAGGDDDTADDDDDDDTGDDDSYEPPPDLGPWFEWDPYDLDGALNLAVEALYYTLPGFTLSLVETMEELTEDYRSDECPVIEYSGPPDAVLKTVTGGCTVGDMEFVGSYTVLDEDAGSFHIYTYNADQYYIRPSASASTGLRIEDDEYFFHGEVIWTYDGQDVLGTFGQGLGELETLDGFEAHYVGLAPSTPEWNHVFIKGLGNAKLNADQQVEYTHDLYATSNGFYSFTSNAVTVVSDEGLCNSEPLSGGITITGSPVTIMFMPDGETSCDGTVNVMAGVEQMGYYTDSIW